ncbi:Trp biosynthesis-associated membrane protein [Nocardioides hwasunensis]|uniref:Trp biosynthesis-associated membrane protein n=1 Tax=Nocardioides hwasunensis TaxID=397258 RepID=A0ABR8MHA2_9ACTN|nr:Trp biosynthesis-associated membrane protein [Nocardioides hwasunensis]MBD3914641.1 Trp biosynthesis-associated membrane protein [Nocardioides hwasunensis]
MAEPDADQEPQEAKPRSTFGPVVLLGLAAAGLAAVAGAKPWVAGRSGAFDTTVETNQAVASTLSASGASEAPLALALALVVLACWGVVLVSRGRFRRAVAWLALLASLGVVATTVEGPFSLPGKLADALTQMSGTDTVSTSLTPWYYAAVVGAVLCVVTTLAAVRLVRTWPEMGRKYDAPTGAQAAPDREGAAGSRVPTDNIDIWKALDEGRDPTA